MAAVHGAVPARRSRPARYAAALGALAVLLGASTWLSGSASAEPTSGPCVEVLVSDSESPLSLCLSSDSSATESAGPCMTSLGVYPLQVTDLPSDSLPSWAVPVDGVVCVQLDASRLREPPKPVVVQESAPSPSLAQIEEATSDPDLLAEVQGFRALALSSAGLVICLLAAIFMRSRRSI